MWYRYPPRRRRRGRFVPLMILFMTIFIYPSHVIPVFFLAVILVVAAITFMLSFASQRSGQSPQQMPYQPIQTYQPYRPQRTETPYYVPSEQPQQPTYEQGYRGQQVPSAASQQKQAQWNAPEQSSVDSYEQPQAQYPEMLPPM